MLEMSFNINDAFIQALQEQEMQDAENNKKVTENKNIVEETKLTEESSIDVPSYDDYKNLLSDKFLAIYNISTNEDGMGDLEIFNNDGEMVGSIYNNYAGGEGGFEVKLADKLDITNCKTAKEACELLNNTVETDTIKISGEIKEIDVEPENITATPSIEKTMKAKKSLGEMKELTERKKYWDPVWKEYKIDDVVYEFKCLYYEVSGSNQASLWGHEVTMKEDFNNVSFAKIPYYNRTWESFEFQSCMLSALGKYMTEVENKVLQKIRQETGTYRVKADIKEQALADDEQYQRLLKLKAEIVNGNKGALTESDKIEETVENYDLDFIKEEIEASIDNALCNVYDKYKVESGDIYPEQALEMGEIVDKLADMFVALCKQNSEIELDEALVESKNEHLTLEELEEKAHNKEWEKAVIVFKPESFDKEYSEQSRSYEVSSDANYFQSGKISSSLFGYCLDGTDQGVRLDLYMKALPEDNMGKRWLVDYCYIVDEDKIEETININPTFADFYAKVKADDRFINEINDLYAKLLKDTNFSDEEIEREMDRDLEDKVAEILENGAYLSNEASPELAQELNKLLDESKEIKTESKEDDLAIKYNIKDNLDKLTSDLMNIQNVTKVEYDLDGYLDNINAPITLVHYDIAEKESASEYIDAEKELKEQVLSVMKENGVNVELEEFENNDTYFYIVAYSTNWNTDKVEESSEYISKYDELNDLLDTFISNDEARLEMYNTLSDKNETVLNDEEFSEWLDDMKQNHFDEIKSYLDTMAEELDYHMEKINESEDEIEDTENDELDGVDYDETISLLDIAITEIPRIGVEEWGKDDEVNFCLDTIELLKGLKDYEEEIPKVMYDSASPDDWSNGIDEYLMTFKGINYDDGQSDNTYNWSACLTHDLEMTAYDTEEGYFLKASAHRAGDVRGNYTTEFLLKFNSREDYYEAIYEVSSELANEVTVDGRVFTIKPSFFSEYVDIYEQDTDNVWEDVYCTCIEELKEIVTQPVEESKDIRVGKRETIKRESK